MSYESRISSEQTRIGHSRGKSIDFTKKDATSTSFQTQSDPNVNLWDNDNMMPPPPPPTDADSTAETKGQMPPEVKEQLVALGATDDEIAACTNFEESKELAESKGGTIEMKEPPSGGKAGTMPPPPSVSDIKAKLIAKGVSEETLSSLTTFDALMDYCEENGISPF